MIEPNQKLALEIRKCMVEMAKHHLKEYFILKYEKLFKDQEYRWWLFVIELQQDYFISAYEVKKVTACKRDEVCYHALVGTFRVVSVGGGYNLTADTFLSCLESGDGKCLY